MYKAVRPYWRQGFATQIARFWASFAFEVVGLRRLIICPSKANAGSVGVLRALGCRIEDDWLEPDKLIAVLKHPNSESLKRKRK
jgi:RimJ/RimL family protein N-acetyltransferase